MGCVTAVKTYRTKSAEVQAALIDYDKPHVIPDQFRDRLCTCDGLSNEWPAKMHIHTHRGPVPVCDGDWLVCLNGRFIPCNGDIFRATYETQS